MQLERITAQNQRASADRAAALTKAREAQAATNARAAKGEAGRAARDAAKRRFEAQQTAIEQKFEARQKKLDRAAAAARAKAGKSKPGEQNCLYHSESQQEAFLVLSGECRLLVEGEERLLRPWDFFHCAAGTEHVFVGAGEGPCVILMAGARSEDEQLLYPVSELAARYRASVEEETPDPKQAYAPFEGAQRGRPSYWGRLPWAY